MFDIFTNNGKQPHEEVITPESFARKTLTKSSTYVKFATHVSFGLIKIKKFNTIKFVGPANLTNILNFRAPHKLKLFAAPSKVITNLTYVEDFVIIRAPFGNFGFKKRFQFDYFETEGTRNGCGTRFGSLVTSSHTFRN